MKKILVIAAMIACFNGAQLSAQSQDMRRLYNVKAMSKTELEVLKIALQYEIKEARLGKNQKICSVCAAQPCNRNLKVQVCSWHPKSSFRAQLNMLLARVEKEIAKRNTKKRNAKKRQEAKEQEEKKEAKEAKQDVKVEVESAADLAGLLAPRIPGIPAGIVIKSMGLLDAGMALKAPGLLIKKRNAGPINKLQPSEPVSEGKRATKRDVRYSPPPSGLKPSSDSDEEDDSGLDHKHSDVSDGLPPIYDDQPSQDERDGKDAKQSENDSEQPEQMQTQQPEADEQPVARRRSPRRPYDLMDKLFMDAHNGFAGLRRNRGCELSLAVPLIMTKQVLNDPEMLRKTKALLAQQSKQLEQ